MKHRSGKKVCEMPYGIEVWIAKRFVEALETHFKASNVRFNQYTSDKARRMKKLWLKLASVVSKPVFLTENLKGLFASLRDGGK